MKSLWEAFMSLFSWFRRKKPAPSPQPFTLYWSGINVAPNGGSMTLDTGNTGVAVDQWGATGVQPVKVACKGNKLVVDCTPGPSTVISFMIYRYADAGATWISGWCPTVGLGAGETHAELDLSAHTFAANEYVRVWIGYPPVNTGTVTVKASVSFTPVAS